MVNKPHYMLRNYILSTLVNKPHYMGKLNLYSLKCDIVPLDHEINNCHISLTLSVNLTRFITISAFF